jgi:hypothetical protein
MYSHGENVISSVDKICYNKEICSPSIYGGNFRPQTYYVSFIKIFFDTKQTMKVRKLHSACLGDVNTNSHSHLHQSKVPKQQTGGSLQNIITLFIQPNLRHIIA